MSNTRSKWAKRQYRILLAYHHVCEITIDPRLLDRYRELETPSQHDLEKALNYYYGALKSVVKWKDITLFNPNQGDWLLSYFEEHEKAILDIDPPSPLH